MKIFFQIIFTLLFVFLSVFFIFSKGVENTVLETTFYEELLETTDISNLLLTNFLTGVDQEIDNEEETEEMKAEVETIFKSVISREWLNGTILYLIDDVLGYAKGEKEDITAQVNIKEQKDTLEQILEEGDEESILDEIPDEIILKSVLEDNNVLSKLDIFRAYYNFYKISIITSLIALLLIIIVLAKPISAMKWIGYAMTSSALFVFFALMTFENVIKNFAVNLNGMLSGINIYEVVDIAISRFHPFIYFYFILGMLLILVNFILKKYKEKQKQS